jgi:hypothetical protein
MLTFGCIVKTSKYERGKGCPQKKNRDRQEVRLTVSVMPCELA